MKKITVLSILSLAYANVNAQKEVKTAESSSNYNRWTIEASVGQEKTNTALSPGYTSGKRSDLLFGGAQALDYTLGARYMMSPTFGVKASFNYLTIDDKNTAGSLPWELQTMGLSLQGVVNVNKLFDLHTGRLNVLLHAGPRATRATSKTAAAGHNYNKSEYFGTAIVGLSPQLRLSNTVAIYTDFSFGAIIQREFDLDGAKSTHNNGVDHLVSANIGLSVSLGKNGIHGDWSKTNANAANQLEIDALNSKIASLEEKMNDTDRDGVADYLDLENNSLAGVAVDTKGRMVDLNKNGVPDELEKYLKNSSNLGNNGNNGTNGSGSNTTSTTETVKRLINENYVSTYFDYNKSTPTNVSTEGIDFVLMYLRNNPTSSVDLIGHADELGTNAYNEKLATARAQSVKNTLMKAGISESRLNVISQNEDTSVDPASENARRLVRRVTFRVK